MAAVARIPRRRGGLSGFLLVLLGLWGGLIPFAGPYFHYGFSPDKAWSYTSGRLYLSVLPGALTLLAGLVVMFTRSRTAGITAGFLAAVAGAWFVAGYQILLVTTKSTSISPGLPLSRSGTLSATISPAGIPTVHTVAEELGVFLGLGVVIVFFGALAVGRFSMLGARDLAAAQRAQEQRDSELAATGEFPASSQQFPLAPADTAAGEPGETAATSQFPVAGGDLFTPRQAEPLPRRADPQAGEMPPSQQPPGAAETATSASQPPATG